MTEANISKPLNSKHYQVRKEIVWCSLVGLFALGTYQVWDWWAHLNWPPHDGSNKGVVKNLKCDLTKYVLYHKDIPEVKTIGGWSGALDRRAYFEVPQCAAADYLYFEGTGVRLVTRVYDREKKRRTATIVTTFDKYEGE